MENKYIYRRLVMLAASLLILAVCTCFWGYTWYTWYDDVIGMPFFRRGNWLVIGVYALLSFSFTNLYGGYKIGFLKRGDVIYSSILSSLFVNTVTYLQVSLMGRRFLLVMPILILSFVDVFTIVLWAVYADKLYQKLFPPRELLVVYGSDTAESVIDKLRTRGDKYQITEMVHIDDGFEEITRRLSAYQSVLLCDIKGDARNRILKYCFANSIRTYLTPKISDTIIRGADKIHLFDTPLLLCRNQGLSLEQSFLKRTFDLAFSLIVLPFALPFMGVIAAAIKLCDRGPVLYKQTRLTKDGKTFELYKFRSMVMDAEKHCGAQLARQNDDRITPVGRIIRKLRLDELPQLFNILRGDMSVVGPRPERPEIAEVLELSMPEFSFRLKVKAGLTGYAQVLGKYNTTAYDKLKLDLMYIENYSFLLDLQMILMTIKILFVPASTEGVAEPLPAKAPSVKKEKLKLK